jgi:sec-independent protein translocase protein TatA
MGALHPMHLALVLVVVLLVFGPKKLPELARGVGDAMKELQKTLHGADEREAAASPVLIAVTLPAGPAAAADSTAADPPTHLAS